MKSVSEIARASWQDGQATKDLAAHIKMVLAGITAPIGTTALYGLLQADLLDYKGLTSHAYNARQAGLLDGYFTKGGKGMFGKPKITWHASVEAPAHRSRPVDTRSEEERQADLDAAIAHDMGED